MPESGESQGYFDFNPNNNTIIYHCCTTGSNQPENVYHMWWYDVVGQSGRDKHTSPKPSQQALQPGGAFDAAHNVFIFHGGDSFVGTWSYNPTTNTWRKMNPSGTLPDPSLILPGLAYSSREQKLYLFGGLSSNGYYNDLYVYDYPTNTWAMVTPAGGVKPSARNRQAFAYDSTNNIFLMYGGQNTSGNLNDTWVFDPSANQWTQINSPQYPPVPGTASFAKLSYDSDHNAFVLAQAGTGGYFGGDWSAYALQTWLFRYQGTGPNAGIAPVVDTRPAGALNRNTASWAKDPALATDGTSLYVGWSEVGSPFDSTDAAWPHIFISQYLAGSWIPAGSSYTSISSTGTKEAHAPSLAVVSGKPWASWYESDNAGNTAQVFAKNWNGSTWQGGPTGINGPNTRLFQGQSQIAGVGATPYVAVLEVDKDVYPQRTFAYVRGWNGTSWTLKGGPLNQLTGPGATALSVSIAGTGSTPYAAWSEYMHFADTGNGYENDTNPKIYVSSWNGTQWVPVGGALNIDPAAGWAYDPSIAVLNGQVYVAWTERSLTGNSQLYVKVWNGSSWIPVGSGSLNQTPVAGWAYHPSLVADATGNQLYLGWIEQAALGQKARVYVARNAAGVWTQLGGMLNADPLLGSAQRVSIGVFNNQPVAAWGEVTLGGLRGIYAKQWNGSGWTLLSGTGGPADTTAPSTPANPSALGASATQIQVAWQSSSDIVGVTGYFVYRGGVQIAEVTNSLGYTDSGLTANTSYSYQIAAHDAAGNISAKAGPVVGTTFSTPVGSGGSLVGSLGTQGAAINLTTEGTLDWAHWGLNSAASFEHKAGISLISNFTGIGGPASQYFNNPAGATWTGGTPTASVTNTKNGVYISGYGQGFRISAPADPAPRTLRVYVGVHGVNGRMRAQLTDSSAPDFTARLVEDLTLPSTYGVFTFTYKAATAGQSLIVTYTQDSQTPGNVSFKAATLAGSAPADFTVSAAPASQTVPAGNPASYTVSTAALGGFGGSVTFSVSGLPAGVSAAFNPATVAGSGSTTLSLNTTAAAAAGTYPLVVTAISGTLSHPAPVSLVVTVPSGGGGVLTGSMLNPTGTVQLTTEGSADWAHWGLTTATDFDHKATLTQQISNFVPVAGAVASRYANNSVGYTWTDGTPTPSTTNSTTGLYVSGLGSGFQITAPADATLRTLKVYVGAWRAQGRFLAHLSDGSAVDYLDTSLINTAGVTTLGVYTLTYKASSNAQTLTVTYTMNSGTGNVTLQAATLAGGTPAPDFTIGATPSSRSVVAGSNAGYTVTVGGLNGFAASVGFSVSGMPIGITAAFSPTTVAGSGTSALTLTTTATVSPGTYPLTLTASSGTLSHTANISLTVTAAPDFTIGATPSSRSVVAGSNSGYTLTVGALNGFAASVGFSVSGMPIGVTAVFSPTTVAGSGTSALTLTT
ncbi:MAG: kelch repeat-containing protein, partial [Candidatus Solibacter sp.]